MPRLPPAIDLTLHPERRRRDVRPMDVDLRVVVLVGITLWVVAGATFGVLQLFTDHEVVDQLLVCAAGVVLGLLGLVWERANRRRYRAGAASTTEP
ncbi:DUF2530 domain-containing protein [Sanguibacter antarcticus]|uniref:Uncharacterized protein DUF2530 n=1 Tax=Sanguibacter antarcticus TaxID=372484 RepID=A0A2A9E0B2_9MICO|nr:DUF2530 domain-containing protein [Sanguibacter antarcticus]PFG32283.1 uncharacterized protein DUF2530 [Sanguibacter antarcticus]